MKLYDDGHILQIIPAPGDMWLPTAFSCDEPRRHGVQGFGRFEQHARVAYFALVEADKPEDGEDEEPRFERWVEMRDSLSEPLDSLDYGATGPCERVKPGEWSCEGHFSPVDEAEYRAEQERLRLVRAEARAAREEAKAAKVKP